MPIDSRRFPRQDRPKVEIRRRPARPAPAADESPSPAESPDVLPFVLHVRSTPAGTIVSSPKRDVAVASMQAVLRDATPIAEEPLAVPVEAPKPQPAAKPEATTRTELAPAPPVDSRTVLLKPSELAVKEVPTLRYDSVELGPMLEEMAVRKVLLEQTLSRMKQALDEERDELVRESREASGEPLPATLAQPPSLASPNDAKSRERLGLFFWLGSVVGTLLLGWGLVWLAQAALVEPAQLKAGGAIAIFGFVALASNLVLHLDALWPRGASRAEA